MCKQALDESQIKENLKSNNNKLKTIKSTPIINAERILVV